MNEVIYTRTDSILGQKTYQINLQNITNIINGKLYTIVIKQNNFNDIVEKEFYTFVVGHYIKFSEKTHNYYPLYHGGFSIEINIEEQDKLNVFFNFLDTKLRSMTLEIR